jgi:hypothetical protein
MGIQLNGTSGTDVISAVDGSLTVEGLNISDSIIHLGDTNTKLRFPAADTFTAETGGTERLRIASNGNVGINTNNPTEILDVRGDLVVAESLAVNRPRIVLSAPNDGTNFRHLFGANLQVNSSGTFTTPTANISGGGWEYLPANSLNAHGSIRYLSAPDTNATTSTPVERLRINANGDIVTQGLTDHSFNNDNANAKILEMTGDGTVGEYGSINVSGNQNADGSNIGSIKFVNRENSNSSSSSNAGSRVVAGLQAYIETSDTNAGDDSGGYLKFLTKSESGGLGERLRIKSDGTVYTYTEGAKFGVSQDPTLTTMGSTSGTWQLPEVDGQTIGAEMRIGDINSNSTALIRLASYGSGNSGTAGGAIMFTNTRCGSASHHSDLAAIKGARESLGKGYLRFFTASSAANTEKMRITADGEVLIGGRSAWGSNQHPNDANKVVITGPTPTDTYRNILMLEGSETNGAINTGGSLAFGGHDGNNNRNWANIWGMKENGTGGNTAGYMAFHTRPAGGNPTERLRIDSSGFIKQKFTSNNSTTAEGLFINNLNNGTGNNASLIFSNDSGERKKAAIAHIDNGNYGHGDFVFALDGGDSGSLHLTNDERVRIKPSGVDYTLKVKGADQVEGNGCDTWSASLYFSSGATHTICTFSTGGNDSQAVATMDYAALYSYASNNRWGGQVMAIARKTSSNSSAEATNNIDAATGGTDSNIKPTFFWDVSTPGAVKLKVTTGSSVQVVGRIQVTYKDSWTLTRNYSAE